MQNLHKAVYFLFAYFLLAGTVVAQTEVQQRVERYLYANYNANKAAMHDNERMINLLEHKLGQYHEELGKGQVVIVKTHEKEIKLYLQEIERLADPQALRKFIEAEKVKQQPKLKQFSMQGLGSSEDALICRKMIIIKLAEHEIMKSKQEKLVILLKNDQSRINFIQHMLVEGKVNEELDVKTFTATVDQEVDHYKL